MDSNNPNYEPLQLPQHTRLHLLQDFMSRHRQDLVKSITLDHVRATIVPDGAQLQLLAQMIRKGQLVSFPTETVYGLGADATNEQALLDIYRVKKRPLSDPIIVHVLDYEAASKLVVLGSQVERDLFRQLTDQFWPGPLTIILRANLDILPAVVTAQTGFVGIRSPKSQSARALIQQSGRPIGAPSANLFSHVSPTSACHVFNDFYDQQITIVEGPQCEYGVESTVVKIVDGNLEILRQGSFSTAKLRQFITKRFSGSVGVSVKQKVQKKEDNENMEAPGQLLKHYAPYLPCYFVLPADLDNSKEHQVDDFIQRKRVKLNQAALISFSPQFQAYAPHFKYSLSSGGNDAEQDVQLEEGDKFCSEEDRRKMRSLYGLLRKAQNLEVEVILIGWAEGREGTLWDKVYRATQGNQAMIV